MSQIIATHKAGYREIAYNEINKLAKGSKIISNITNEIMLVELPIDFNEFISNYNGHNLIFIQHIFPVDFEFAKNDNIKNILLNISGNYSLQYRCVTDKPLLTLNDMNTFFEFTKESQNVLNALVVADKIYFGLCKTSDTTSKWSGGEFICKRDDNFLSRAEYKLLEAINLFDINFTNVFTAIDLGAAPGGWSMVLSNFCNKVIAIDPAELDGRVLDKTNVEHFKGLAQQYNFSKTSIDIIVNDMRMDGEKSCRILISAAENLDENKFALITLKLPSSSPYKAVMKHLHLLEKHFELINVRQLFNNRNEVTVYLKKL